ncbi:hypothetical protein [Halomonas sp.]|uniref:hypothetical protein n=1 Tax=Halomonas sp. TaxID=1486246 RepID=UPI003A947610
MSFVKQEIIESNAEFVITRHIPENKVEGIVVISFDTITGGLKNKGFGTDFLNKNLIENIFVSHRTYSFYQGLSLKQFYDSVKNYLDDRKVYTYGSSLGAYAAVFYAGVINAKAIALAPRCSIDPIYSEKFPTEYKQVFYHEKMSSTNIVSKDEPIIVFDPLYEKDILFVSKRIALAYPAAEYWEIPNGTHSVALTLKNSSVLKDFFFKIINGENFREIFVDVESNPSYSSKAAGVEYYKKNFKECERLLAKCFEFGGSKQGLDIYRRLLESGELKLKVDPRKISDELRLSIVRQFSKQMADASNIENVHVNIFEMNYLLMEYNAAYNVAKSYSFIDKNSIIASELLPKAIKATNYFD